jgi:hypothetical protein
MADIIPLRRDAGDIFEQFDYFTGVIDVVLRFAGLLAN